MGKPTEGASTEGRECRTALQPRKYPLLSEALRAVSTSVSGACGGGGGPGDVSLLPAEEYHV